MNKYWLCLLIMTAITSGCSRETEKTDTQVAAIKSERKPADEVVNVNVAPAPDATMFANKDLSSSDPAFISLSKDETEWMRRNGFLTNQELRSLEALGDGELLSRSRDHADMKAATALGLRRLKGGDTAGAITSLDRAARSGSLFALEQLAFAELKDAQSASRRDAASEQAALIQFAARMEQAKMMGDHRADYYLTKVAGNLDRRQYGDQILQQTTEYMRQMAEDAAVKGVQAKAPDHRPNIDQWQKIASSPNATTSASTR